MSDEDRIQMGATFQMFTDFQSSSFNLPCEGGIAVRAWQTTAVKPFREIFTTPFTRHAYGDKAPLDVDAAVEGQPFLGVGASMTDASAWLLFRMTPESRRALLEAVFSPDPAKGARHRGGDVSPAVRTHALTITALSTKGQQDFTLS